MSSNSAIEWTDATWNPVTGCTKISPGCANCYIERTPPFRIGHRQFDEKGTTGVQLHPDRLEQPLHWRKPRRVFVNSLSDLFHDDVPSDYIDKIFGVMALCQRHTFQILTKRPLRMFRHFVDVKRAEIMVHKFFNEFGASPTCDAAWNIPLPNVWLGVSVESQHFADERIPLLLQTPAAVRFISAEPLLGPVDLNCLGPLGATYSALGCIPCGLKQDATRQSGPHACHENKPKLDWVIVGGESGPGARPMHPDWARSLRDQCVAAGVKFFFKQWGEWLPAGAALDSGAYTGRQRHVWQSDPTQLTVRVGKASAGRLLDGREWNEFPQ